MTAAAALSRVAPCVRFPPARAAQRSARASAVSPRGIYALKPIGRSPAYFRKKSHWEEKKSFVVSLFGGGDAKIRIAALEYELDNSRAQSSKLNIEKRAAEAKVRGEAFPVPRSNPHRLYNESTENALPTPSVSRPLGVSTPRCQSSGATLYIASLLFLPPLLSGHRPSQLSTSMVFYGAPLCTDFKASDVTPTPAVDPR
jgi:uncharacterized small protein (DUF1192 family)